MTIPRPTPRDPEVRMMKGARNSYLLSAPEMILVQFIEARIAGPEEIYKFLTTLKVYVCLTLLMFEHLETP